MKALIWIGAILFAAIFTVMLRYAGIVLGGLPTAILYGGVAFFAFTLCKKLDQGGNGNGKNDDGDDKGQL